MESEKLTWKKFSEELPPFDVPIFVYRPVNGLYRFFQKEDDIRRCTLVSISTTKKGVFYELGGYHYHETSNVRMDAREIGRLKWMKIPNPNK